jgi:hypothetical protein
MHNVNFLKQSIHDRELVAFMLTDYLLGLFLILLASDVTNTWKVRILDKTPTIKSGTNMPVCIPSAAKITTRNKALLYSLITIQLLDYESLKINLLV